MNEQEKLELVTVIIPVFNEEETVQELLRRVQEVPIKKEVIIVNDGSTDGSRQILDQIQDAGVQVIHHGRNQGKGTALTTGLQAAKGEIIIFQDADLEYDPKDYPALIDVIRSGKASVVYGSRLTGGHTTMNFLYHLGNRFLTLLFDALYNVSLSDIETGSKVFRRSVLEGVELKSKSFDIEIELTAKTIKRGYRIYEIPVSYSARMHSEGKKLTWRDGVRALAAILRFRFSD